jgi:capsular exopolysaccharide synthesis family protein
MLSHQVTFGFVEAFRTLRTNLYLAAPSSTGEGKVVLVTSPSPGDGKSTCALSLAWILAADGKRVLVIDADLRKPSHFALTEPSDGEERRCDLLDVLNGECPWQDVAKPIKGSNQAIYSLSVDRPASAEVLSGRHIRPFLNDLRRDLDYIIIDTASFPLVSDALIVAPAADATISVIRPGNTPRKLAVEHVRQMCAWSNVYGILVNDSQVEDAYGGTYPRVA